MLRTAEALGSVDAIVGHSLGGKVALDVLSRDASSAVGPNGVSPDGLTVVALDAIPGKWDALQYQDRDSIVDIMRFIKGFPVPSDRRTLKAKLEERGFSASVCS